MCHERVTGSQKGDPEKIILLDFDGVLNSKEWYRKGGPLSATPTFDPACIEWTNRLVDATGAKVVLSTAWYVNGREKCRARLAMAGFCGDVVSRTRVLQQTRGLEIESWLRYHGSDVDAYVVLDDDADVGVVAPHILIDWHHGLQDEHVDRAIAIAHGGLDAPPARRPGPDHRSRHRVAAVVRVGHRVLRNVESRRR